MFRLNKDTISNLQSILGYIANHALSYRTSLQDRGLLVQQYIEKASDRSEATVKGRYINQILKDKSKIGTAELAIARITQETAEAYLAGAFLTGMPIFQAVSTRERESTAEQLNVLTKRDQDMFGWVAELLLAHKDVLKRPICAVEVTWEKKLVSTVTTTTDASGKNSIGAVSSVGYQGNRIKRLDPDNLLFDTAVPPWKVHTEGTFAGYVEKLSYVQSSAEYSKLDPLYLINMNKEAIWKNEPTDAISNKAPSLYYKQCVHSIRNSIGTTTSEWEQFWGGNNLNKPRGNTLDGQLEWVHLYVRIPLADFGGKADAGIHVCKMIYINGYLAYFEPLFNSHGMLPIILGQMEDGTVHTNSHTEYVLDLQDLGTSFVAATMSSLRRAVSDRAIYDPSRISPSEVESPNPAQKIKVSVNQYQQDIKTAYQSIPYEDRVSPQFVSMIGFVEQWANKTMGQNPASQGTFVKGNKTQTEFTTIMNNSDARMQLGAVFLENNFYSAIKQILRMNYLIHAVADTIPNNSVAGAEPTTVDPVALREEAPMYQMASGLMPAAKLASTDLLVQGVTFMRQDPMLSIEYDTGAMFISILKQQGLTGLDSYKRTPEQQAAKIAQLQALSASGEDQSQPQETAQ